MKKYQLFVSLAIAGVLSVPAVSHAQFADTVVSYTQGAGVISGYNIASSALGAPSQVTPGEFGGPVDPFDAPYLSSQIVGVGTGGSLTLQFNTPILNHPGNPFGIDFIIFGHAGFSIINGDYSGGGITDGSFYAGGASSVQVSVSADGATFYKLNPLLTPQVDGLFPTDGSGNPLVAVNPGLSASDFNNLSLSGIRSLYAGSAGGAGFNLNWAVNSSDQSVFLPSVSYVRLDVLGGGDPAYIDAISAVPEPATSALALAGATLLWARRRKK